MRRRQHMLEQRLFTEERVTKNLEYGGTYRAMEPTNRPRVFKRIMYRKTPFQD